MTSTDLETAFGTEQPSKAEPDPFMTLSWGSPEWRALAITERRWDLMSLTQAEYAILPQDVQTDYCRNSIAERGGIEDVRAMMEDMWRSYGYVDIRALDTLERSIEEKHNDDLNWDNHAGEKWE